MIRILIISFRNFIFLFMLLFSIVPSVFAAEKESGAISTAYWWDQSSHEKKVEAVRAVIDNFKKKGIVIRKEPEFYVRELDLTRANDPKILALPIGVGLRSMFIMYRDFDNGKDPDELIREVLSEEEYGEYVAQNSALTFELIYQDWRDQQGLAKKE